MAKSSFYTGTGTSATAVSTLQSFVATATAKASQSEASAVLSASKASQSAGSATAAAQSAASINELTITDGELSQNNFTNADHTKLNGIEASATADQTNAEIRALVEAASNSNVFTDADHTKLNGIEASATADQTNAEIRASVEAASNSNVFTDADHTKLNSVEASATADQTNAEIKTAVEAGSDIALGGNPTTTTQSAGNNTTRVATTAFTQSAITALVDSSPASLNTLNELAAALGDDANFSTTVTNSIAAKLPLAGGAMTGAITTNSTFDGRDVAADGVLATNALPKSGGAMTGAITTNSTFDGRDVAADGVLATNALPKSGGALTGAVTTNSTIDGRDVSTDGTKLDGIEASATADQTSAEIRSAVEAASDSNVFTDADHTKLAGIASSSNNFSLPTAASSTLGGVKVGTNLSINGSGVLSATDTNTTYSVQDGGLTQNNFTNALKTKLDGVASSANNYSHPSGAGNNHIPTGGSSNQFLKYSASGVAVWAADNNTTYSVGDGGLTTNDFTNSDHSKLNGIASGATAFTNSNAVSAVTAAHLDMGGKRVLFGNLYSAVSDLPSASTYHGMFAHVHATGLGYYAHAGAWVPLARSSDIPTVGDGGLTTNNFTDADHSKLNGIEASATADQTGAQIRAALEAASDSNIFTDADHTKLNGIAASANNYSPPNHTGEITSSGDGATVIAGNVVDEANLKVSNGPVDGYMLTAQSGNTGGLTWAAQPSNSLPSLAGAGKVLTINSGNSAATWATPSGGGVSEDTVIALAIALG